MFISPHRGPTADQKVTGQYRKHRVLFLHSAEDTLLVLCYMLLVLWGGVSYITKTLVTQKWNSSFILKGFSCGNECRLAFIQRLKETSTFFCFFIGKKYIQIACACACDRVHCIRKIGRLNVKESLKKRRSYSWLQECSGITSTPDTCCFTEL